MTAKRHDEKEIVAGMQTKTRARPYVKCCVVEQKSESKGRSERRVRKVAEEHIMVCGMQLEMIAEKKSRDALKGCWRKHTELCVTAWWSWAWTENGRCIKQKQR